MKRIIVLAIGILVLAGNIAAQDIIVTRKAEKIEAKILEVSNSEIKYKKLSNLEGPTFVTPVAELQTIIYENGDVQLFEEVVVVDDSIKVCTDTIYSLAEWKGGKLPKFGVQRVHVPGKKYKKSRYVAIDGSLVLKTKDFVKLIKAYCPEATANYNKYVCWITVSYCFVFILWPLGLAAAFVSLNYAEKILESYNNSCATQTVNGFVAEAGDSENLADNTPPTTE